MTTTANCRCEQLLAGWTVGARTEPNEDRDRTTRYHNRHRTRHRCPCVVDTRAGQQQQQQRHGNGNDEMGRGHQCRRGPPPRDNHNSQETTRRMTATPTTTSPLTAASSNCSWGRNGSNEDRDGKGSRRNDDDGMISTNRPRRERLLEGMETRSDDDREWEWDND